MLTHRHPSLGASFCLSLPGLPQRTEKRRCPEARLRGPGHPVPFLEIALEVRESLLTTGVLRPSTWGSRLLCSQHPVVLMFQVEKWK